MRARIGARAEDPIPACLSSSATPVTSGASGPITTSPTSSVRARESSPFGIVGSDRMALAELGDSRIARRGVDLDAFGLRESPRKRVLAPARPDEEDPHCSRRRAGSRQDTLALGAGADENDVHLELPLDELDVGACRVGQVVEVLDGLDRHRPAWKGLVDRPAVVEVALMRREVVGLGSVLKPVANAHRQLRERGEDVELRERQRRDSVQPDRVTQGDEVEPSTAALSAGNRPELASELPDALLVRPLDLRGERAPRPHA